MATARDVLKRAMRLISAIGAGEEPTAEEGADGLAALNSMLDAWWSNTLAVFYVQSESFTWPSGQSVRTMGTGGNFSTTRPIRIESAFQRDNDVDYQIRIITRDQYDAIPDKTTQSTLITEIYPEYRADLVYLYAYPVPSVAVTVHLKSPARLQSFASLTTDVALPPGYLRALEYNLAVEIAPEYQLEVPAIVQRNAWTSLRALKRTNLSITPSGLEIGLLTSRRSGYDYHTGD